MKKPIGSFVSFTRTERTGLICLSAMLLMLLTVRVTMTAWVRPAADTARQQQLRAAWETFKNNNTATDTQTTTLPTVTEKTYTEKPVPEKPRDTVSFSNVTLDMLKKRPHKDTAE